MFKSISSYAGSDYGRLAAVLITVLSAAGTITLFSVAFLLAS